MTRLRVRIDRRVVFAVIVELEFLAVVALDAAAVPEHPYSGFSDTSVSEMKHIDDSEEHGLPGIPVEQAIDEATSSPNDLTRDADKGIQECLELHLQHTTLLFLMSLSPTPWMFREHQGPPGFEVPG